MKQNQMSAADYRKLVGADKKPGKQTMSGAEWQEMMRKKGSKPVEKNKAEIALMLKLAKIEFEEEYKFHPERKWRFDFAIPDRMIAIEYEGIYSEKSGHTTHKGYTKDTEKYNEAAKLGWRVLRYTANNYKKVVNDLWNIQMH